MVFVFRFILLVVSVVREEDRGGGGGGGGGGEVRTVELDRSGLTLLGMTVL